MSHTGGKCVTCRGLHPKQIISLIRYESQKKVTVLVFCRAERYFCRTKGRNRGESISAIVSAISAGEKGHNLLKPDNN